MYEYDVFPIDPIRTSVFFSPGIWDFLTKNTNEPRPVGKKTRSGTGGQVHLEHVCAKIPAEKIGIVYEYLVQATSACCRDKCLVVTTAVKQSIY